MTAPDNTLAALAQAYGVATDFWDWQGVHTIVSAESITHVLSALGVDVSSPEAIVRSHEEIWLNSWRRTLPPTVVMRAGWTPWVPVHVPDGRAVRLEVALEDGGVVPVRQVDNWVPAREVDGVWTGQATFELPGDLPLGWHILHAFVEGVAEPALATVIVTPQRLEILRNDLQDSDDNRTRFVLLAREPA